MQGRYWGRCKLLSCRVSRILVDGGACYVVIGRAVVREMGAKCRLCNPYRVVQGVMR